MSTLERRTVNYHGWNCLHLSNGHIELMVTLDVGPRIIHCALPGGPNCFKEYVETLGAKSGDKWNIYGGHRLWHAPEEDPRTYFPDNTPVAWEPLEATEETEEFAGDMGGATFLQMVETTTGIEKQIEIRFATDAARVEITHYLTNRTLWPVELAPWALSVMDVGGTAIIPLPPRGTHPECLSPTSSITLWPFTNMSDPRWTWGEKFILLRQDENASTPQKIGVHVSSEWAAYANKNQLFVKHFPYYEGEEYPDFSSVVETFTNHEMLELETLAPTEQIAPGEQALHIETWELLDGVAAPRNDAEVEANILPLLGL